MKINKGCATIEVPTPLLDYKQEVLKQKVKQTSCDNYRSLTVTGELTRQQKEIVKALKILGETCIADLAAYLNWQRSTVSGRRNELIEKGIVEICEKRKSQTTGITSEFFKLKGTKNGTLRNNCESNL